MTLKIIGLDPSLRNWGMVSATYDQASSIITVQSIDVIRADLPTNAYQKQNALDVESAKQLYANTLAFVAGADFIFAEIPQGSQSARASMASGICIGVLGAIQLSGIPFIGVTPNEVKLSGFGTKSATKKQMIEWAVATHPEAKWPTYKMKGQMVINSGKAEHMCDALAAIYAGMKKSAFTQHENLK